MYYTYTREWCDISEAALKFEPTLDPIEREIILEAYKRLMEDLTDARLSYDLFCGDELRHTGVRLDFFADGFLTNGTMCKLSDIPACIRVAHMHYITKILTNELLAAESDGVLGENVDTECIDIYYLSIAALLETVVAVYGDLKTGRALAKVLECREPCLPIAPRNVEDVKHLIEHGSLSKRGWAFYGLTGTNRFLLVQPSYIDQDTLFEQMYQVALGHAETLLDRAHYAYGLCDPCHQPTNYIRWSLANRECEQAYKLQPITGEYGESIFSLSQYTSENVA